jgi:hypothetical protein
VLPGITIKQSDGHNNSIKHRGNARAPEKKSTCLRVRERGRAKRTNFESCVCMCEEEEEEDEEEREEINYGSK